MQSERGSYGEGQGGGGLGIGIGIGLLALIYGLSPGARHLYKHGYLPHPRSKDR